MEKYTQFRDKGTAIAPFLPVPTPATSPLWTPVHIALFLIRLPIVVALLILYFVALDWVPVGQFIKKCVLWLLLLVSGVWWVDLQVDTIKRGGLADQPKLIPQPGTIIASSFTSPLDALYLGATFSPIFTRSYPGWRDVEPISLFRAIMLAFTPPALQPSNPDKLVSLKKLQEQFPRSILCVFPETTTTNGRGVLPFSPSLLTADSKTKIFPVNVRYTPADITTPVPGNYIAWLWKLLSRTKHSMRVRVAMSVYNNPLVSRPADPVAESLSHTGYDTNIFENLNSRAAAADVGEGSSRLGVTEDEQAVLDRVGEDLARMGRIKRVGLGVREKIEFVKLWTKRRA